jgi:hypothetical protein
MKFIEISVEDVEEIIDGGGKQEVSTNRCRSALRVKFFPPFLRLFSIQNSAQKEHNDTSSKRRFPLSPTSFLFSSRNGLKTVRVSAES